MKAIFVILYCAVVTCIITPEDWKAAQQQAILFVGNLTLDEKISLATGVGWGVGRCVMNTPPILRVNFSGLCLQDSPTGVRFAEFASAFPAGINAASTWDRALIYNRAAAMGQEYRGKGVNGALGPMINMGRVPAGGRNWEGFGADPYLTGEAAAQTVLGIQDQGVMAQAKHFILNEQEHFRTTESSNIDDRTLHEIYGWPFIKSVEAGVVSIMCSYNQINNTYACQNNKTLNQMLKGELGFQGFVMSDDGATMSTATSVLSGLDMTNPGGPDSYFGKNLTLAVQNGSVPESRINDMAVRIISAWYVLGQDKGFPATNINWVDPMKGGKVHVEGNHYEIIRQVGAASNVLLKNLKSQLPFTVATSGTGIISYAIIGSDAGPSPTGPNECPDHGCDIGTLAQGWGSGTTNYPYLITPLDGIQRRASLIGQTIGYSLNDWDIKSAVELASTANVAIVFSNADSGEGYITVDGNMGDRNNLSLWNNGDALIEAVASVNPNTVVVAHTVGPILMPWINNPNVTAVIIAGLPGQESGNSLADVLFGDVNPSGRLVYTLAKQRSDYPAEVLYQSSEQYPQIPYTEGLFIDYRWFDYKNIVPQFEFGFGLSYTTFSYSNLLIQKMSSNDSDVLYKIQVTLTNTGKVNGFEVPQLYIGFPESVNEPPKVLRGFDRLLINAGENNQAVFYLTGRDISIWDVVSQAWLIPSGTFKVYVGASSRDIRSTGSFSR